MKYELIISFLQEEKYKERQYIEETRKINEHHLFTHGVMAAAEREETLQKVIDQLSTIK